MTTETIPFFIYTESGGETAITTVGDTVRLTVLADDDYGTTRLTPSEARYIAGALTYAARMVGEK